MTPTAAALSFILMLDYSGSMDQQLEKTPKIQIVQTQVHALLSSASPEQISEAIVFGTRAENKCKDIRFLKGKNKDLQKGIQILRPGTYGKTPLTQGFRTLVSRLQKNEYTKAVVITDGADTCGENPCEYLKEADKTVKTAKPYDIVMVGLDLKEDKDQMQCFKELQLKNFKIHFADVNSKEDLLNQLKAMQSANSDIDTEIKDSARTGNTKIQIFKLKNQNKSQKSASQNGKQNAPLLPPARLEISGAPETAHFSIQNDKFQHAWEGPFAITAPAGEYKIRFDDPTNGTEITFKLAPGTLTKIPWAQLMKNALGELDAEDMALTLQWTPEPSTKEIHGEIKPIETLARLGGDDSETSKIPFGKWSVQVISPPWLAKRLPARTITIANGVKNKINVSELFVDEVKWVDGPKTADPQVMVIQTENSQEERHLLPAGQYKHLPILKKSDARWISPAKETKAP